MASDGLRERLADQLDGLGCGCDQPSGRLADAALTAVAAWLRDEAAKLREIPLHNEARALEYLARSLDGEQTTNPEEGA